MKRYFVYMLSSKPNGTLYVGITNDIIKRVWEHKNKFVEGFTKKYNINTLVYFEEHDDPASAILREKRLKSWKRNWKIKLIEETNPEWRDLYNQII